MITCGGVVVIRAWFAIWCVIIVMVNHRLMEAVAMHFALMFGNEVFLCADSTCEQADIAHRLDSLITFRGKDGKIEPTFIYYVAELSFH